MRSTDYPYHHDRTLEAWRAFRTSQGIASPAIDPRVCDSWQRCKGYAPRHDPVVAGEAPPAPLTAGEAALLSTALPYLEDIYGCIAGAASVLVLTTYTGVVLSLHGDPDFGLHLMAAGLCIGACWSEEYRGTNAISLSSVTAMPTQVVGAEHSLESLHPFGGSAAPIYDEHGAIVGVVGIITPAHETNQMQLALMMTTAQAISAQGQSNLLLEQANQRTRMLTSILESVTDGVLTWDNDGGIEHINSMAWQILGVERKALLGHRIHEVIGFTELIHGAIEQQRELSDVEASLQIVDRFVKCLINVRVIKNGVGEVVGGIAMLRPLAQVRSLVHQQVSAPPPLTFNDFEFTSSQMHGLLRQAKVAAKGASPVLLSGEAGVGKTALAQAIHNASPRAGKPLVVLNCSMIPKEFMVEELLGRDAHGSEQGRPSKFELADGGTLVIDQIDQLSLEAQRVLLQVMNSRGVTRLYAVRTSHINVRIVATTALNIEAQVENHSFLPQLYYLFNILHLKVPPLRERREDIGQLANRFLERLTPGDQPASIEADALLMLQSYPYPGNVRELESIIERAVTQSTDGLIQAGDLPENVRLGHSLNPHSALLQPTISLEDAELDAIMRAGRACAGGMSAMAAALGIDRTTLWRKLKHYGIQTANFK